MSDDHTHLDELMEEVSALPETQRESALRERCGDDESLLREALARLAAADTDNSRTVQLDIPQVGGESGPKHIGLYRIRRVIASGGMGTVYLAVQENPRREVALKVMKPGISSLAIMRRFKTESQILARLRHPNIAQVYDAGKHLSGESMVPYFAMEYVPNARSITQFANERRLKRGLRLELFIKVCDAVQHGHQKGIIHRDLKPDNILVDVDGQPKVIDFGVARATDSDIAVTTLQTEVGQLLGTLQYMSPEQCEADARDLDVRTDVYSLGVVFYELVSGALPYDVTHAALHDAAGVIAHGAPATPSDLDPTLAGDIEMIMLKALAKQRSERYQSASDFAADITRYLNHEPISVRPASMMYRFRMAAARHKGVFFGLKAAVVGLFILGLIGVVVVIRLSMTTRENEELRQQMLEMQEQQESLRQQIEALTEPSPD